MTTTTRSPFVVLALALIFALGVPSGLLVAPQKAEALTFVDFVNLVENALDVVYNALTEVVSYIMENWDYLMYIKAYVLEPLTFALGGDLMKSITGGVLTFVSGENGGKTQFIQNLPKHYQGVGDSVEQSFRAQFTLQSNSPYAGVIAASLRSDYEQGATLEGFFAKNQDTLPRYLKNGNSEAFLSGNWSEGGAAAWFALTTQEQNNPYALHARSETQLGRMITSETGSHSQQISNGQGFMSWCGPESEGEEVDTKAQCTNEDGTPGEIKTPGSTITDYLSKSLSLEADKAVVMGDASGQIEEILGSVSDLLALVGFATETIGGDEGLAGAGGSRGEPGDGGWGVNRCSVEKKIAEDPATNGQTIIDGAEDFLLQWDTIRKAAEQAKADVISLRTYCSAQITAHPGDQLFVTNAQAVIAAANEVLAPDEIIEQTFVEADAAEDKVANATARILEIRTELRACPEPPLSLTDPEDVAAQEVRNDLVQELRTMAPTRNDLRDALYEAKYTGGASASPEGWLNISEGTRVDQMTLLSENANATGTDNKGTDRNSDDVESLRSICTH